jgi:predicted dehydrogenase
MSEVKLITLHPGHFHAALVQKEMYPGVTARAHVYAPLGPDLLAHLQRIAGFNGRPDNATSWQLEVHAGPDSLRRMLRERPGNVVVLSGRNRDKIDYLKAAVEAGLNVLADKPWIISADDIPKLRAALDAAEAKGLIAYDIMTERYEITSILQRELVNDPDVFGTAEPGSEEEPGVFMESVHYLMKLVAGVPNRRPAWFFDVGQQGEGLTDVGTHLVDLIMWILFPGQAIDHGTEVSVRSARRWPTAMTRAEFAKVTGEADFPDFLRAQVVDDRLHYYCNTLVSYTVRGVHVKLNVLWDYEAAPGAGDTHFAVFRGSRSRVEVRQGKEQNYRPELYVVADRGGDHQGVLRALRERVERLQEKYPGVGVEDLGREARVSIPDRYRVGHEAHFAEVTRQFLRYLEAPRTLPAWEKANMLAKYFVTTQGVRLAVSPADDRSGPAP